MCFFCSSSMRIGLNYKNITGNKIIGFVQFNNKIERIYLGLVSDKEEGGKIDVTNDKIRGKYANQIMCNNCPPNYYTDFFVDGVTMLDKFDVGDLESDLFFDNLFNTTKNLILNKVITIKDLFRPADERIKVNISREEIIGTIMRFKYKKIKGKFVIQDCADDVFSSNCTIGMNDVLFIYKDDKKMAKLYAFSNYVVQVKYIDEKENVYMYFSGGRGANPVKELDDYIDNHKNEGFNQKGLTVYFINTFLSSNSFLSYIEEIIDETFNKFGLY